jgi:predicted secreted protein
VITAETAHGNVSRIDEGGTMPRCSNSSRQERMNRFGPAALLALAALSLPLAGAVDARAGDGSAIHVIGFSADGRYFAFEQYGEQDGSGTLHSTITAVETIGDHLVKGMPVTAIMDPDNPALGKEPRDKQLADIRAKAAADAAATLAQLGIAEPGHMVASVRDSRARSILGPEHVKTARKAAVATITLPADRFGPDTRLVVREFDIALPRCKDLVSGEHPNGFALTLERKSRPTIHLSRDQTIPTARGCHDHYGIAEAHALPLPDGTHALAVFIQYFYTAFEGPGRRFIVVTGRVR